MKCPWTKCIQKTTYIKTFAGSPDEATTEIIVSKFGECISGKCPFYDCLLGSCRRIDKHGTN